MEWAKPKIDLKLRRYFMTSNPLMGSASVPTDISARDNSAAINPAVKSYNDEVEKHALETLKTASTLWGKSLPAQEEALNNRVELAMKQLEVTVAQLNITKTRSNTLMDSSDIEKLFKSARELMKSAQGTMSDKVKKKASKAIDALGAGRAANAHQVMDNFRKHIQATIKDNIENYKMDGEVETRFYKKFCSKLLEINKKLDTLDRKGEVPDMAKFVHKAVREGAKLFNLSSTEMRNPQNQVEIAIRQALDEAPIGIATPTLSPIPTPLTSREPSVTSRRESVDMEDLPDAPPPPPESREIEGPPPPPPLIEDDGIVPPPPPPPEAPTPEGVTPKVKVKVDPLIFFGKLVKKIAEWLKDPKEMITKMPSIITQIKHVLNDIPIDMTVLKDLKELKTALTRLQKVASQIIPPKGKESDIGLFNTSLQEQVGHLQTYLDSLEAFEAAEKKGLVVPATEMETRLQQQIEKINVAKTERQKKEISDHVMMLSADGRKVTIAAITKDQKGYLVTESPIKDLQKSLRLLNKEIHFPSPNDTLKFGTGQSFARFHFADKGPMRERIPTVPDNIILPPPPAPPTSPPTVTYL
jgi:hypothetical protein